MNFKKRVMEMCVDMRKFREKRAKAERAKRRTIHARNLKWKLAAAA
jgi:hypothetical protein